MFFLTSNNTDFFVVLAEGQSLFESLKKKSGLNFDWTHPGHFNNQDLDNVPIVLLIFVLCFESKLFLGLGRQNFDGPDPSWLTPKFSKNWRRPQTQVVFRKIKKSVLLTFVNYLWHLKRRFISESLWKEKCVLTMIFFNFHFKNRFIQNFSTIWQRSEFPCILKSV